MTVGSACDTGFQFLDFFGLKILKGKFISIQHNLDFYWTIFGHFLELFYWLSPAVKDP